MAYLDENGLSYLWSKILSKILYANYGTCTTAGETVQKEVTISSLSNLTDADLKPGLFIFVTFSNANAVSNPTLKLNNLTAKPIKRYGTTAPSTSNTSSWYAGATVLLIYDGTYWYMENWINTTYSSMTTDEITTGTGTSARIITPARLKTAIQTWAPPELPSVTSSDAGKFLCVNSNGVWAATIVPSAEGVSF